MKLLLSAIFGLYGLFLWGQSGITGQAAVYLADGGTICNGAASIVEVRVDVTGLTGSSGEPAGLNGAEVHLTFETGARSWYARTLSGQIAPLWGFCAVSTRTDQVIASGTIKVVGWEPGDTPNGDYLVAKLVFSGPGSAASGSIAIESTGSLASKWWDDGSPDGDGPAELNFQIGTDLSISIPAWSGLSLHEGCSFWLNYDLTYDFSTPGDRVDVKDLVELVNCLPY
ncbi:MAG: hypothetical protein CR997_00050 [Acidobacteria bacterium]|nr:MAG: hypothetical protein CR997_00050 [Acidobacteriota bacterium]